MIQANRGAGGVQADHGFCAVRGRPSPPDRASRAYAGGNLRLTHLRCGKLRVGRKGALSSVTSDLASLKKIVIRGIESESCRESEECVPLAVRADSGNLECSRPG